MKKILAAIIAAGIMLTAAGCTGKEEKNLQPLTIGVLPDVDSIPLIIAAEKGYFKKEGVEVKIEHFKSAVDRDTALQTENIDGAVSDILAAAFAKEGGFDVKITSKTNGSYKLLVGKDSGINDFAGLAGKDLALSKNTIIEYATDMMLQKAGMKPEDINKQVIPKIPARLEMLQAGQVAAATLPEPLASTAVLGGAKALDSTDQWNINPGVLLFTSKAVQSKPSEIQAFYKAYNLAVEYLQSEKLESYSAILISKAQFPESIKDTLVLPAYKKAEPPAEQDFLDVLQWLTEKKLIKKDWLYKDLVDTQFVK